MFFLCSPRAMHDKHCYQRHANMPGLSARLKHDKLANPNLSNSLRCYRLLATVGTDKSVAGGSLLSSYRTGSCAAVLTNT